MDRLAVRWDIERQHLGQGRRPGELVGQRLEGHGHPDHRPDARTPDARRADDDVSRDLAAVGDHATDVPVVGADSRHRVLAEEPCPALHRATRLRLGHANGVGEPVRGHVIGSEDLRPVDERPQPGGLVRVDDATLQSPGLGEVAATMQLGDPLRRQRQLQTADRVETPRPIELEARRLRDGVLGEALHRLRRIGLEDDPGRMAARPAGLEQPPLLDDRHIGPAAKHELIGDRTPDDARSDDDDARFPGHGAGQDTGRDDHGTRVTTDLYSGTDVAPRRRARAMRRGDGLRPRRHRSGPYAR